MAAGSSTEHLKRGTHRLTKLPGVSPITVARHPAYRRQPKGKVGREEYRVHEFEPIDGKDGKMLALADALDRCPRWKGKWQK